MLYIKILNQDNSNLGISKKNVTLYLKFSNSLEKEGMEENTFTVHTRCIYIVVIVLRLH